MYNKFFSGAIILVGVLVALVSLFTMSYDAKVAWLIIGLCIIGFGILWLFVSLFNSMDEAKIQIHRFKTLLKEQHNLAVAISYKTKIEKEFRQILTSEYPAWEESLVTKFSLANEKDKEALLAICPKLETGSSYEKYVKMLKLSMDDVAKMEREINESLRDIAVSDENPWLWFHRPIPANIQELLSKF